MVIELDGAVDVAAGGLVAEDAAVLNGGSVTTAGGQTYSGPVTLGADTVVTGAGATFDSAIDSAGGVTRSLTVDTSGDGTTAFGGAVGGTEPLLGLTTNADGTTELGGDVTTSGGAIAFHDPVVLTGNSALRTSGGTRVDFHGSLDGAYELTVEAGEGDVAFDATVGGSTPLSALSVEGGAVAVSAKTTVSGSLSLTGQDDVTVNGEIDPTTATFSSADDVVINEPVTAEDLITVEAGTDGTGSVWLNAGASLTTTEAGSDVSLSSGATLGDITLAGDVTALDGVSVAAPGGAIVQSGGAVQGTTADLDAATGISDGAGGGLQLSALRIAADNTGAAAVRLANTQVATTQVTSLTTRGAPIVFQQSGGGNLQIVGGVASGEVPDTPGGTVTITSAAELIIDASIDTRDGSGGDLIITGGVTVNETLLLGAGDIVLNELGGAGLDVTITAPQTSAFTVDVTAPRDIVVLALLRTTGAEADILLRADNDADGLGGVRFGSEGQLDSARDVLIEGSDYWGTPGEVDSVRLEGVDTGDQVLAARDIVVRSGAAAPADARVLAEGDLRSSGDGDITVSAATGVDLGGDQATAGGDIRLPDPVMLTDDVLLSTGDGGGGVVFESTLDGDHKLTVGAGTGDVDLEDAVGATVPLSGLAITSARNVTVHSTLTVGDEGIYVDASGVVDLDGSVATLDGGPFTLITDGAPITVLAATTLTGDATLSTGGGSGDIVFGGSLDGVRDLALTAGTGDVVFREPVGAVQPLGDVVVHSARDVSADAAFHAASFVQEAGTGETSFASTLSTAGAAGSPGGAVNISTEGDISIRGLLDSSGGPAIVGAGLDGGDVALRSAAGSILLSDVRTAGSDALAGEGGNAGDVWLQPDHGVYRGGRSWDDWLPRGLLVLHGDVRARGGRGVGASAGRDGDISLAPFGRGHVPSIATITGDPRGGDVTLRGADITMGQNEKFTVLGDLWMLSDGGRIALGDLTARNMVVDARGGRVVLLRRRPGDVRLAGGGVVRDAGLDFVARGRISFGGTLVLGGAGSAKPQFASLDVSRVSGPPVGDLRFVVRRLWAFPDLTGSVLDAAATGTPTTEEVAETLAVLGHREVFAAPFAGIPLGRWTPLVSRLERFLVVRLAVFRQEFAEAYRRFLDGAGGEARPEDFADQVLAAGGLLADDLLELAAMVALIERLAGPGSAAAEEQRQALFEVVRPGRVPPEAFRRVVERCRRARGGT